MDPKTRRTMKYAVVAVIVLLVLLYLVLPSAMGIMAVLPGSSEVGAPPRGFQEVQLKTSDGVELSGWYRPSTIGRAIILLHGSGGSREDLRPYMDILSRHGYGVLALDLRGHGASSGKTNRYGWSSSPDVEAAVRYLENELDVKEIGAMGLSLGGEILLGAAQDYPQIKAIITDGATQRSIPELLALESERSLVRNFTARVMYAAVALFGGEKPPPPLLDSILNTENIAYFFIAAGDENQEVRFNQLFHQRIGPERSELWIAPQADHMEAFRRHPQEYEERLIQFLQKNL